MVLIVFIFGNVQASSLRVSSKKKILKSKKAMRRKHFNKFLLAYTSMPGTMLIREYLIKKKKTHKNKQTNLYKCLA